MERPRRVGMAWFERATYPRILEIMEDSGRLPVSYEQWLVSAEQIEETVLGSGVAVVRAPIEPQAFANWCAAFGLKRDGAARSRFAAEAAKASAGEA